MGTNIKLGLIISVIFLLIIRTIIYLQIENIFNMNVVTVKKRKLNI